MFCLKRIGKNEAERTGKAEAIRKESTLTKSKLQTEPAVPPIILGSCMAMKQGPCLLTLKEKDPGLRN